jgi:hypothetical protein
MGFRFRRSLKILPGVRLNFSNSGVSTTLGPRGATVSLGKRGPRANVGIPGTGISYSTALGGGEGQRGAQPAGAAAPANSAASNGCGVIAAIGFVVLAIATCSKDTPPASDPLPAKPAVLKTGYVSARSLNCRAVPDASATVVTGLSRGGALAITEESGTWSKVENGEQPCWVSSKFVSDSAPAAAAESSRASTAGLLAAGGAAAYSGAKAKSSKSTRSKSRKSRNKLKRQRTLDSYDSQGCPCSGSNICIGPRGGRYCITSGGNKRYGV